ncbi:MAG TPA: glutamine amidotransferase [Steroidobacteraceae bacterium]
MAEMRVALAVRHVHFEDCGTLAEVLSERGIAVRYLEAGREALREIDVSSADLVIGLGGPIGVCEDDRYPWIRDELKLLERSLALGKPVLGICLGAQMLAHILGARVYASPIQELGWKPLRLTEAGSGSAIAPLAPEFTSLLHWHGDTFELPRAATLLASTAEVAHQIFECGPRVLGFQCHPEIRARDIEAWLIGHAVEIARTEGAGVEQLRRDTLRFAPALARQARAVFDSWLAGAGL